MQVPGLMFVLGSALLALSCAVFSYTLYAFGHLDLYTT